jgi:protein tyrosine phosphatase
LQVSPVHEENLGYAVERTLQLVNPVSDEAREVKHWQVLNWPSSIDVGAARGLVDMIERIDAYGRKHVVMPQEESIYGNQETITEQAILQQLRPTVVHCSAGVGRTGAFCAAVICLQRMQDEGKIDLFQVVKHLRTQRPGMVQTAEQYAFVYRCVLDWLDRQVGMSVGVGSIAPTSIYATTTLDSTSA